MDPCYICYDNINVDIECLDKRCTVKMCSECFEDYLNHCFSEKSLPRCIGKNCRSFYVYLHLGSKLKNVKLYCKTVTEGLINNNEGNIANIINTISYVNRIREEKKMFVKNFPRSIDLVVNVALKKKLMKIEKNKLDHIKSITENSNKLCMNSHCNGKLDANFECIKCTTVFCKNCEKIKREDHQCSEEDVKSLSLIGEIRKCPNCGIHIEKSDGCNHMTCSSCKTNFNYNDGSLSNAGSHNAEIAVQKTIIYFDFREKYDENINNVLDIIENMNIVDPSYIKVNNMLVKLLLKREENKEKGLYLNQENIKKYDMYLIQKQSYINFIKTTLEINELHISGKLTHEELINIVKINGWN